MCGIITIVKKNNDGISTPATITGMLKEQIERGEDGFGFIGFGDKIESYVRRETKAQIQIPLDNSVSQSIMFHHRFPTSTPNFADCTHPIKVSHKELSYDYYFIHNGMISNHGLLHDDHIELGYVYQTGIVTTIKTQNNSKTVEKWNDSEALAIDVSRFIEGKQDTIKSRGSIAFVSLQVNKKTNKVMRVYYGRNTSPLTINITENTLVLRSEGESASILPNTLYALDLKTWKVTKTDVAIGEIMSVINKSDTDWHYFNDNDGYQTYGCLPKRIKTEDTEGMIAESYLNSKLRDIDEKRIILDEQIGTILDVMEYYREGGNVLELEATEKELSKLEDDIDELEREQEELLDESMDYKGVPK